MFIKSCLRFVLCLSLLHACLVHKAWAVVEVDLYSYAVILPHNADAEKIDQSIKTAFGQVLIRMTGSRSVIEQSSIQTELNRAKAFLSSSSFTANDTFVTNILGEQIPTKALQLRFDPMMITQLLSKHRLPIWSAKRPEVLMVLADRMNAADHLLADGEEHPLIDSIEKNSQARGIPYVLPIMDLEDSLSFRFSEVYGLFLEDIQKAAERYQVNEVLTGRIVAQTDTQVKADLRFYMNGTWFRLPSIEGSYDQVFEVAFDFVSDKMASMYAVKLEPDQMSQITIRVSGLQSLVDLSNLEQILLSLHLITDVVLSSYDSESALFLVTFGGAEQQLRQALSLEKQLHLTEYLDGGFSFQDGLSYEWQ